LPSGSFASCSSALTASLILFKVCIPWGTQRRVWHCKFSKWPNFPRQTMDSVWRLQRRNALPVSTSHWGTQEEKDKDSVLL
jgi:hypothetical protein